MLCIVKFYNVLLKICDSEEIIDIKKINKKVNMF